jgi:hypothetical protein
MDAITMKNADLGADESVLDRHDYIFHGPRFFTQMAGD